MESANTVNFDKLSVQTNFGHYDLKDAIWTEDEGRPGVGTIKATVVSGGVTNRIFHHTSFTDHAGTVQEFHNVVLSRMHPASKRGDVESPAFFDLCFFG